MSKVTETYVKVFGRNSSGDVLMLRRGEAARSDVGLLDLPGGKVEPNEDIVEALARETLEETGLTLNSARQLFEKNFKHPHEDHDIKVIWYVGDLGEDTIRLSSENSEHKWVKPSEILDLLRGTMRQIHNEAVGKYVNSLVE